MDHDHRYKAPPVPLGAYIGFAVPVIIALLLLLAGTIFSG